MNEWYNDIKVKKLSNTTYRITNPTKEHMFLIVGKEKAALIDTGGGYGDLTGILKSLTDLPILLLNTHGHPDHIGGNGFFQEAFMSSKDLDLVEGAVSWKARKGFMAMVRPDLSGEFDAISHVELPPDFKWRNIKQGQEFDLGGLTIKAVETPGHTEGSVCFLNTKEQVLYTGDLLAKKTVMIARGAASLVRFMETLRNLQEMLPGIKVLRGSHGEGEVPKECIWNLLSLCIDILNHKDEQISTSFNGNPGYLAKEIVDKVNRKDGVWGNIVYSKDHLYEE